MATATKTQEWVVVVIDDNDPENVDQICSRGGYTELEAQNIAFDMDRWNRGMLRYEVMTLEEATELGIE